MNEYSSYKPKINKTDLGDRGNKLMLERQFGKSSFDDDSISNGSNEIGEITGNNINKNDIDRGMPMRSQYTMKKEIHDANIYTDFNLHDKISKKKTNIKYNESNAYDSFADIQSSTENLSSQINPIRILSNGIESFGTKIFNKISSTLKNDSFVINTVGLYTLFSVLFIASNNTTQHELEKFFNYPKKMIIHETLPKIWNDINNVINIKNLIVASKYIPHNTNFIDNVSDLCIYAQTDTNNIDTDVQKLNYIIDNMMGIKMKNAIKHNNLENLQLMLMSVGFINPKFYHPFDRMIKGMFAGYDDSKQVNYLLSIGKTYNYYEDNDKQLIEFKCGDKAELLFGIIVHKEVFMIESSEKINFYTSHAKPTLLDEVRIPMFSLDSKIRYNNVLKNLGLNSIFIQVVADELFPQKIQLHDIIQNIKFIVNENSCGVPHVKTNNASSMKKFIVDHPFIYYLKLKNTNTILMNGSYQ